VPITIHGAATAANAAHAPMAELADPNYRKLLDQCIHCGLCLQACPTYAVYQTEMDSPRGRIVLMRAASEGRIGADEFQSGFAEHLTLCLECRACETACPSGVQYGALIQTARIALEHHRRPGPLERFALWVGLRQLMPRLDRLLVLSWIMWVYEMTGLQWLVRALHILPRPLSAMEAILPPITPRHRDYRAPAPAYGPRRGDVAFFIGCIQEAFLSRVNEATIRVLQRNGYEVHFPAGQTCCGAAQLHVGDDALARELARQNIDAFLSHDYLAVINNAGGCGATLKEEYEHLFKDDPVYAERARQLGAKVQDISEFLAEHMYVPPTGELHATATYSDSCHLRHAQKIVQQPRALLRSIRGLKLVELAQPDRCCGSAGIYNIVQSPTADAVLDMKMADIAATGADLIVTSNTGCHMQLIAGTRRAGLHAKVVHVVEVLDMAYGSPKA
jgi:glycolate oxidase iron-sulfur subunit